jgi:hypothetical protein
MDVKHTSDKGSTEKRIADRLKPSNEKSPAQHHTVQGNSAQRVSTTVHGAGSQASHGEMGVGEE